MIRILASTTMLLAVVALPATAQTGDTRARVDLTKSHIVVYPNGFETSGEHGTVTLVVGVGTDGLVTHVKVAQTSGYGDLDVAASETAMNWKYVPATHEGDVRQDEIMLKVVYNRPDPAPPAPAH